MLSFTGKTRWYSPEAEATDGARMRGLAGAIRCRGEARLRPSALALRRLARDLAAARVAEGRSCGEALRRLAGEAPRVEACMAQARAACRTPLPAMDGRPRIGIIAEVLLEGGEAPLTQARLTDALRTFDAARPLRQVELWAVPDALRVAVVEACAGVAASMRRAARECAAAEGWVRHPSGALRGRGPAFFAHALMRCAEDGLPAARARLDRWLAVHGLSPERVVRQAQEARAYDDMRLENLMAARRLCDAMDWEACFEALCAVEIELNRDPSGIYPRMDDASRRAVREQVALIARRTGFAERSVARRAVEAAREHPHEEGQDGLPGTVCWWLWDDAGRHALLRRLGRPNVRLPRMVPDPRGTGLMAALACLTLAASSLLAAWLHRPWLLPACLPLGWGVACSLAGAFAPRFRRPLPLLKLDFESLPEDAATLVVTPVLLTDIARAEAACDDLESLGWLERDERVACLLLGDFADADHADMPGDQALLDAVRARIARMNARAGREKFYYLHRPRTLLSADNRYMGRDRKRGALMDLNRVLLGLEGAPDAFSAEGSACAELANRFRYVVTLDADTRLLPGTVRRLAGTMAHPLNRRYAVLQPRMEALPSACANGFVKLFAGPGGVDTYPASVSDLWMDLTGRGAYAGKGIYDVATFHHALDGALKAGRVLSHDLIEGATAGTAGLCDTAFYDGFPTSLGSWARRLHRWTRGDWQLLQMIFARHPLKNGRSLSLPDRFRMLGNLLRSLRAPALFGLFLLGAWTGSAGAVAAGMALCYLDPLLHPLAPDPLKWRRATVALAILPLTAFTCLDAALRALWRSFVSGRRLLEWVPSAEAERGGRDPNLPNRVAALLMLPGLFVPGARLAALALFMLFWVGADWVSGMANEPIDPSKPLDAARREAIVGFARDTWRFFEAVVPLGGPSALPPDNRQLDPPVGDARRTSPTNIALYLAACAAAHALGFIGMDEVRARLSAALDAMDRTEKWRGHLFNWIDIDTLAPLRPRYVSSVDSGNLAACAIMCAGYVEGSDPALAERLRALAEGMDFAALYDGDRELFLIGFDAETGHPSQSHYDLLASESRILSYAALMLGQVPAVHWRRLGRGCVDAHGQACLASWSGTMFEYLMPELLMPAPAESLLGRSVRAAVSAQIVYGRRHGRPWGVSESGFHAFDAHMRYQYRAFGLPSLALSGQATGGVVAPYAAALALSVRPREAADDLIHMEKLGWRGELGFYEAADGLRPGPDGAPSLVKSHMAHHQGMALCAMCNTLTGGALSRAFMADPRARAMSLLLEERPCALPKRRPRPPRRPAPRPVSMDDERTLSPDGRLCDVHLLSGQEAVVTVDADGAVGYVRRGMCAHRPGGLTPRYDAARVYLSMEDMEPLPLGGRGCEARCDAGCATYTCQFGGLRAAMTVSLSPEDDTLFRSIRLTNSGRSPLRVRVLDLVPVSLAAEADWIAHPAFQGMFVRAEALGDGGLLLTRTARGKDEVPRQLVHAAYGARHVTRFADFGAIMGRTGGPNLPEGRDLPSPHPLDPASVLCAEVALDPGETGQVRFALKLLDAGEDPGAWLTLCAQEALPDRAARLNRARALAMRDFLGIDAGLCHRLDRLSALLIDPSLAARAADRAMPTVPVTREDLWAVGLSGDRPMLCMSVTHAAHGEAARTLARAHAWFASMNLPADLVFIDDGPSGYDRPVRGMLAAMIDTCDLRGRERAPGGVWVLDGHTLTPSRREAIHRAAAAMFHSGEDFNARLRRLLGSLDGPARGGLSPLALGPSILRQSERSMDNGFGGFTPSGYAVDVRPGRPTPAPWCWMLADGDAGLMLTERGGGFLWLGNSRSGRLTPWRGDALREGWGLMPVLAHARTGRWLCLLPGEDPRMPFEANYAPERVSYRFASDILAGETTFTVLDGRIHVDVSLSGRLLTSGGWEVMLFVDWLMGVGGQDAGWVRRWTADGACFATGAGGRVGWLAAADPDALPGPELRRFAGRGSLSLPMGDLDGLPAGDSLRAPVIDGQMVRFCLGMSEDAASAQAEVRAWRDAPLPRHVPRVPRLVLKTPDAALDRMFNLFLPHQIRTARLLGRTGLYQPGGAFGFRDQLQDVLALIPTEPDRVREHLLACAARQFPKGDVLHWWHPPYQGVRTRISDDRLFLPWVTAAYLRQTGDAAVLMEPVPYLEDAPIPEGRRDLYRAMSPGEVRGTLHDHCMRAFRSVKTGAHGLALMGGGDWNDGMDRVGSEGIGESVWLSEFVAACAESYADACPDPIDALWLRELADRHRDAMERQGWDGRWYRRAWMDDGTPLGSADSPACRIDLIAQAWAVLARLDAGRCASAMDAAWEYLVDEEIGAVKLLDPPFCPEGPDPGYIRDYPAGVRENGAQYTHGACWFLLAMIRMGDAERAHRLLSMLLPPNHADTPEHAARYRVEPYVTAADIYTAPGMEGRGGWTWYTGSAAWLYLCILELLGYERRGDQVRLTAKLGSWNEAALTLPYGESRYQLVCRRDARAVTLDGREVEGNCIHLIDDGRDHEAVFPPS